MKRLNLRKQGLLFLVLLLAVSFLSFTNTPLVNGVVVGSGNFFSTEGGRKTFFANGRYWLFFDNTTHMVYVSSTDANSWTDPTSVRTSGNGNYFSVWTNSSAVFYAWANSTVNTNGYFRIGIYNASTSLWDWEPERTFYGGGATTKVFPAYVSVATDGYPWIAYRKQNTTSSEYSAWVVRATNTIGSLWGTHSQLVEPQASSRAKAQVVPTQNGGVYVVYEDGTNILRGRIGYVSGGISGSEHTVATDMHPGDSMWDFVASTTTSNTYVAYCDSGGIPYDATLVNRSASTWSKMGSYEVPGAEDKAIPRISMYAETEDIYMFWEEGHGGYIDGQMVSATSWDGLGQQSLNVFYNLEPDRFIGTVWARNDGDVHFLGYAPNTFTFYGVYDENTGLLKTPSERAVNITAYHTNATDDVTFEVNGTYYYGSFYQLLYFHINLTSSREYWVSSEDSEDIYIFDDTLTSYIIEFTDLAGVLDDYSYVTAERYVNGTLYIVEKRRVDIKNQILMSLINGVKYTITIQNGASYVYGDLLMTPTTTVTLTLRGIDFPQTVILAFRYVRQYAERHNNFTSISLLYEDLDENTNSVNCSIYFQNETIAYTTLQTADSFNVTWTSAWYNTTYIVRINADHGDYGTIPYHAVMYRGGFNQVPWSLDFLGTIPGMNTSDLIPIFLVFVVAGLFSKVNAFVGAFMAVIMSLLLSWLGWFSLAPALAITALFFAILMGLAAKKKGVAFR